MHRRIEPLERVLPAIREGPRRRFDCTRRIELRWPKSIRRSTIQAVSYSRGARALIAMLAEVLVGA
ncbi:hypothetical protein WI26_16105 [Burkholderia diffusa]|nr:hypothetical protein WI26_16105 [Burkholderia diffusa]